MALSTLFDSIFGPSAREQRERRERAAAKERAAHRAHQERLAELAVEKADAEGAYFEAPTDFAPLKGPDKQEEGKNQGWSVLEWSAIATAAAAGVTAVLTIAKLVSDEDEDD